MGLVGPFAKPLRSKVEVAARLATTPAADPELAAGIAMLARMLQTSSSPDAAEMTQTPRLTRGVPEPGAECRARDFATLRR